MPGFDETENEIKYRVRNPDRYDRFGRKEIGEGVSITLGHHKQSEKWEVQSIQFNKENFTLSQAESWIEEHDDLTDKISKYVPGTIHKPWVISMPITKSEGGIDSEHFYIYGSASVEIIDKEGDKITVKALKGGLPQLLRRRRLSLVHTDIIVGEIVAHEVDIGGTKYKTEIVDDKLMVLGDIWADSQKCVETRKGILNGTYNSYSISGESLENSLLCDRDQCWNQVDKMDLSAVAICEDGMNQAAKFTILKAFDDFDLKSEEEMEDTPKGGIETKKEKEKGTDETQEPTGETKQEEEAPTSPEEQEEQEAEENAMVAALKAIQGELAELKSRVDAMEQAKDAEKQEDEEEKPEDEEDKQEDEEKPEDEEEEKADTDSDQTEKLPAGNDEQTQHSDETKNENPEPPTKKSLAKDAGGSQFDSNKKPKWEQIGEMVAKKGGLNKMFSH